MKAFKNVIRLLVAVGIFASAKLALAVGIPADLRMHLAYDNTQAEVKFTDKDWVEHKVQLCEGCRVEIWNDGEDSLPTHFFRNGGELSFMFLTEGSVAFSAFLSIKDAEGNFVTQNGVQYEYKRVHPAHPLKIMAESEKVTLINQYDGDGVSLDSVIDLQWIFGENQTIRVETKPGQEKGPEILSKSGYFHFGLDSSTSIRFTEKGKAQATELPIYSGATEIYLECVPPTQKPSIPCRVTAWKAESPGANMKLILIPYDGKDVYHPQFHEFTKLKIKKGATVKEYALSAKGQVQLISGPATAIQYTPSGSMNDAKPFNGEAAKFFSQEGNVVRLGVVGQTGGPVIAANPKVDSPGVDASGSLTAGKHCTHGCGPDGSLPNDLAPGKNVGPEGDDDNNPADGNQNGADGSQGVDVNNPPQQAAGGCSMNFPVYTSGSGAAIALLFFTLPLALRRLQREKNR